MPADEVLDLYQEYLEAKYFYGDAFLKWDPISARASWRASLDHAFYHLDGKGQIPHLDMLLSIERLRGIQWVQGAGAPPAEEWLPLLKRIRDAGKLCQVYVNAEGARTITKEIGGRGFIYYIYDCAAEDAEGLVRILSQSS